MSNERQGRQLPPDFEQRHIDIIGRVAPFTITSPERVHALIEAVRYVMQNEVPGAFLECGVYRGGSMMAVALTLLQLGVSDRDLLLFDTYEGMPKPGEEDIDLFGRPAREEFDKRKVSDVSSNWANASLETVRDVMAGTGYPMERVTLVKGMVEDTLPESAPDSIALLRLDTDWYQSTLHELTHLYDRVAPGGVIIIDDYGYFRGARRAVDEFLEARVLRPFLHRVDYTARLMIKDR